ncbi:MAG TPA: CoA-binding protein [Thermoanaerobaculia bacterium]|nr:CoA-binding protein [Thermoanaerobaculia bacterium]
MATLADAAREFLTYRRIAVAGVSRRGDTAANAIYTKLRGAGYTVFAVNPNGGEIEGDRAWETIASIPGGVEGVVIATHPAVAAKIVRECAALGIRRVWMHRSVGGGSVDDAAVQLARDLGIAVIPGSCPLMFCEPVDFPHKCMRWVLRATRHEARPQGYAT